MSSKTLHLGYSSFGRMLSELSKPSVSQYTHLNLRHSALGQLETKKLTVLLHVLVKCATVKHLDLRANNLGDNGIRRVASALLHPQSRSKKIALESINLWDNFITSKGTRQLGLSLSGNTVLKQLNLGRNCLEDAGILALVVDNKIGVVEDLNVRDTYVGDTGASVLASVKTIQTLNLSRNEISDVGCDALLFGEERGVTPFHTLDLSSNAIQNVPRIIQATQVEVSIDGDEGEQEVASTGGSATSLLPGNLSLTNQHDSGRAKVERVNHCWVENDTGRGQRLRAEDPFGWDAR